MAERQSAQIFALLEQDTRLTEITRALSQSIEELTKEIHGRVTAS